MMHLLIYCILQTTITKSVNGAFFEDEDKDTEDFNDSDDASENLQILESFLHDVYLSEQRKIIFGSGCESKSFQTENLRFTACSIEFVDLIVKKFTYLRDVFVNDDDERATFLSELEISIDTAIKIVLDAYKQTGKAFFVLVNNDERALEDAQKQYKEEEAAQKLQMEDLKNKQYITREEMDMYKREYEIIKKGHFYAYKVTGVDVTDEIKTKIAVIDEFFSTETEIIETNPLIENIVTEERTGEEVEQIITKL